MSSLSPSALIQFLSQSRSALLLFPPFRSPPPGPLAATSLTLVLGNPSCDLDSFVSATLYAFFHSRFSKGGRSLLASGSKLQPSSILTPILNLPSISSRELWRLRPEFGTALRLAVHGVRQEEEEEEEEEAKQEKEAEKALLENLVTIDDIRSSPASPLHDIFTKPSSITDSSEGKKQSIVLVDHNVPAFSIPSVPLEDLCPKLDVVGCIDHRIDEAVIPHAVSPRIIETGIGSCTTLVVKYLRHQGFWDQLILGSPDGKPVQEGNKAAAKELATLSLAAILIDTANLTAAEKVSALDEEMVAFLESVITADQSDQNMSNDGSDPSVPRWDRHNFYNQIAQTKANSLSLLTLPEILARDYKGWSETATPTSSLPSSEKREKKLNLGISSIVKPISWLIDHHKKDNSSPSSSPAAELVTDSLAFARQEGLDIFVLMTSFNDSAANAPGEAKGEFKRELCIFPISNQEDGEEDQQAGAIAAPTPTRNQTSAAVNATQIFEQLVEKELGLEGWTESHEFLDALAETDRCPGGARIWTQTEVTKSRKQVAPLLRQGMRRALLEE